MAPAAAPPQLRAAFGPGRTYIDNDGDGHDGTRDETVLLILLYLGAVALTTWALLDVGQTPAGSVRVLPKGAWALLTVVPFAGPLAWFLLGTDASRTLVGGGRPGAGRSGRPLGPDDDPDFLRELGRREDRPE